MMRTEKLIWVPGKPGEQSDYYGWHEKQSQNRFICYTIKEMEYSEGNAPSPEVDRFYRVEDTNFFETICENNGVKLGDYNFTRNYSFKSGSDGQKIMLEQAMRECQEDYIMKLEMISANAKEEKSGQGRE